ncbi:YheC/YheD family protein [Clostridium cellulovorans]|uniref:ATP-grasp domain-containing protein n=1 Tax=Clostridium cellulovorans (strain ATCC 35296 / DSM 3052 / OCM 3 / 743B) TaxID=573061 RepID=D9SRF1_CLOC7|nr:YheC/YheD family protein [Clostridium cellulovorans]ADL52380.1 hypothetical protein Clocel_2680 [Clostridium cellulovorans 743B]
MEVIINKVHINNDIYMGPVIGIFTGRNYINKIMNMEKESFYYAKGHIEAALEEKCLSYFFCTDDIDYAEERIKGCTFNPELNRCDYAWFPFPEVIYVKKLSYSKQINEHIQRFKEQYNIQLINDCTGIKNFTLYKKLSNYTEIQKYLPETIVYKNFDDVLLMLNKYGFIFIKSAYSKKEKVIFSIEKINNKYKLNYFGDSTQNIILNNLREFENFITEYLSKSKFIVQQGIKLLKYKDYTISLHLLMMKNICGKWEAIYRVVKMIKEDFNITDDVGKKISTYEKIYYQLQKKYQSIIIPRTEKINDLSAMLASYTEMSFGTMGEMNIDIGIDINGRIWIIKANCDQVDNLTPDIVDIDGVSLINLVFKNLQDDKSNNKIKPQVLGIYKYSKFLTRNNHCQNDNSVIKVIYKKSENDICYLTEAQNQEYCNGDKNKDITIKFGSISLKVKKVIENRVEFDSNILYLSENLKSQIFIPDNSFIQVLNLNNNQLEFGPLVGTYINSKKIAALSEGKTDHVYEEIAISIKKLNGVCCLFSIGDIDWEKKLVKGMIREKSKWIPRILPLPMVIYDRCFGIIGRRFGMEFRKKLGKDYKVINSIPKLAKWETICALEKNPRLIAAIPKTILYKSYEDIEKALRTSPRVYLKPDALYKGKGIFRVSKEPNGIYKVEHRTDTENEVAFLSNLQDIDNMINHYSVLGGGYLIQQEIKKASYRGYPFDFRLLYQKDWQGIWQPTGIAIRMGAPGSIITSPRSGGAVAEIGQVLKEEFNEDITTKNGLYEKIVTIGREAAETIDAEFGDCVELGLDMTIDIDRQVWIIEINGKPLKVSLKWLKDNALMSRCYTRPIEYAVFLTGFQSASTDVWEA